MAWHAPMWRPLLRRPWRSSAVAYPRQLAAVGASTTRSEKAPLIFRRVELGGEPALELREIPGDGGRSVDQDPGDRPQDAGEPRLDLAQLLDRDAPVLSGRVRCACSGRWRRGEG